jgi:Flp pilus assembly protein TadD
LRLIVAALFSMLVLRCAAAQQQPIAGTDMSRWLDYQEKLNQSREEMELRSRTESSGIPGEATISVARLRHTPPGKALKAFQHGLKLNAAGDAEGSAEAFRQALVLDPAYAEAHTDLGVEYINLGLLDDAVTEFRNATALDPATSVHHANLGLALIILGRFRDAEPEVRTAVTLDPTNMKAQYLLGFILANRPEYGATGREALAEAESREYVREGKQTRGKRRGRQTAASAGLLADCLANR